MRLPPQEGTDGWLTGPCAVINIAPADDNRSQVMRLTSMNGKLVRDVYT